ncbi:Gfo/Idh/MocA family oxidoreductase, partial [Aduncisulcus paluster]
MKAGKHVLCEKPFAVNEKEVQSILDTAKKTGCFVMEALWTLYLPAVRKALDWVQSGAIGDVRLITADFGDELSTDPKGRIHNPELAGGALLDVGIYPVLLSNAVTGLVPYCINANALFTKTGVDETTTMSLKYGEDTTASLGASVAVKTKWNAVIYGNKGHIEIPEFFRAKEALLMAHDCEEFYMDTSEGLGYQHEAQAVTNLVAKGEKESRIVSHDFSLDLIRTLDRIR